MEISKIQTTRFYKKIVIGFSVVAVIILGLIIYFSLAKTVITVTLKPQETSTSFYINVKKELAGEDKLTNNALDGYLLKTEVSGSQDFANTNQGEEVEDQATGTVTIYNNWSQEQPLAATTRLLTPENILFRIQERVDVPAGGKLENVEVYADQPGAAGNIGPTKFTIPGLWPGLQDKIYAESTVAMTGGLRQAKVLTDEITKEAKSNLSQELVQKAITKFEQTDEIKNSGDKVLEQALYKIILSEEPSAEVGQEIDTYNLEMNLRFITVIFNEDELFTKAVNTLKQELANDQQLESYDKTNLIYSVDEYNFEDQTASLRVQLSAKAVPRLSSPIFNRDNITGKDSQQIKAYFANYDEIGSVTIKLSPFWVTKAPGLKDHIEIKIK